MIGELTLKRSPVVLMWRFAAIETAGFLLYFAATLLGNAKYEIYAHLSLESVVSYQTAKILFLFGAQFAITAYAFLSWYYEEYSIRAGSVAHRRGVFARREEVFRADKTANAAVEQGFLGKLFHYGSVRIRSGKSVFVLRQIGKPERAVKALKGEYDPYAAVFKKKPDVGKLLAEDEHAGLEFKSSLRFDRRTGNVNRELEKAAMKTVAAFLNSGGGYLVIGVSDKREPVGLENDYRSLQRKDSDGFENHFTQTFNGMIGPEFRNLVKLWFHEVGGSDVCVVQAAESPRPVYMKADNGEYFYVRTGNISTPLKLSEMESYFRSRWPKMTN